MLSLIRSPTSRALRQRLLSNSSYNCAALYHSSSSTYQSEQAAPLRRRKHVLSDESKEKVDAIFQRILYLDMVEVHLVTELINQKMGIVLSEKEQAALRKECDRQIMAEAGAAESNEETEEENSGPSTVDLKLTGFDAKSKIKVIKEVRSIAGLGLKEAKELVEGAPKVVTKDLSPESAEELKAKLEAVGAEVELV